MANRVTIQDIADELGLSRNTVSKAINNTGVLADATRQKVLAKAIEMGYKQFTYMDISSLEPERHSGEGGEIALLTASFLDHSHFASSMLDRFQSEISQLGYSMSIHNVCAADLQERKLPDAPVMTDGEQLNADILLMDNTAGILSFIKEMKRRNRLRIGFIGDVMHCTSFFERYMAFRNGMFYNQLPIDEAFCLTDNSDRLGFGHNRDYILDRLNKMKTLPDVFICANDFVAVDLLQVLESVHVSVPERIQVLGFDDSPESRIVTPKLSTIHIHSQVVGFSAVQLLVSRIREPELDYRRVYVETNLILRASTGDPAET